MNKNFSKHHKIIENFRGVVSKPSFDDSFIAATGHLTRNERFLLKMELKRLGAVCTRAIDLRGLVDGECQLFDFEGQSHFLDDVAISAFKENVDIYGGYTFGVYELVKDAQNSFRNLYQNDQISPISVEHNRKISSVEKVQYPAKLQLLANYPNRSEERMNFAIPITLTLKDKQQLHTTSVDISVNGLKFKLMNEVPLFKGDQLTIAFTGLEQEFQFSRDGLLTFEVKNALRDSATQLIGCQRTAIPEHDSFSQFLSGYIQGNKRRYKINLDNSLAALQARSLEQYALVKTNELVVFMQGSRGAGGTDITPRYALTTNNNKKIYHYWQDDKKHSTLHYLMNTQRMKNLQTLPQGKSLLVFSFIHRHKGRTFFYTVDEVQLKHDKHFFKQFLAFSASKSTFSITALKLQPLKPTQAYSPFTLATAMTKQQSYLNPPLTDEVQALIANLPYLVTATDITSTTAISDYQSLGYVGIDLERLKSFGHKYGEKKNRIDEIALGYGHQRQEVRFKYKTPVSIDSDGGSCVGQSADFSVSGLKIDLENPAVLPKDDIIYLSFPKLQKITSAFDLKKLPYKVIRISQDKTVVNLRVSVKEHQHIGRSFFKLLINKNKDKLTPDEYAMLTPGLSGALRTLYAVNMVTPTAMVQSSGSRYKVERLVVGQHAYQSHKNLLSAMLRLSDRDGYYNLYPLLANSQVSNLLDHQMKQLLASEPAISESIYIAINPSKTDIEKSVIIKLASDFETPESRSFFIKKSLKQGDFYSLQLKLSRSDEAHMEHLNPELAYIGGYAIHRGKQLEQEIYSVAGLFQLIDVTQEALLRYELTN
ncbi:PilZ domain-containing protein [Colwellia piezophila]|uniref:PilZ domain-containing protein n=1 Tax=Colwellia piezophila TaxID=211668 RepID=UPI00037E9431|nr:PilZ domain-containing protein [Colwellia piezophila]